MEPAKVRELIDVGAFTAADARKAGLVDRVEYASELRDRLAKEWNAPRLVLKKNYGRRNLEREFEGMAGMMKMMSLLAGGSAGKKADSGKPKIAVIYAAGAISTGPSQAGLLGETLGSDTLIKAIRQAAADAKTKGVVLRIDSPGGSALASDLIWHELKQLKKPFVASMGDVAASGGYYIAMGADKIYAEPGTLTGSIGVVGGKLVVGGLFSKLGMQSEVLTRGKNAELFSVEKPFSDSGRAVMQTLLEDVYRQFTAKAAQGRKMPIEKLLPLAGGRVWTGRQAKANGLIDELGTLDDAIAAAKSLAKLDAKAEVEIEELPRAPGLLEALLGPLDRKAPSDAEVLARWLPHGKRKLAALAVVRLLAGEKVLLTAPFAIEVR